MALINIKNLLKKYGKELILDNVDLNLNLNEFVFVVGESGSGKTTLLNCLGLLTPFECESFTINRNHVNNKNRRKFRYNFYSYIFQDDLSIEHLTVKENLKRFIKNKDENDFENIISKLDIEPLLEKYPNTLSGGEKQKVSIARALLNYPKIIIADEPTGSLDVKQEDEIMQILKNNSDGKLLIIATHNLEMARKYGTKIIRIINKKITVETLDKNIKQIDFAESNINYKKQKLSSLVSGFLKFLRGKKKYPLIIGVLLSLILFILNVAIGLKSGISEAKELEIRNRLDSRYYQFDLNDNAYNYNNLFSKNNIKIKEYYNLTYFMNAFVYNSFSKQNRINFSFDFSVIDFKLINSALLNKDENKFILNKNFLEKHNSSMSFDETVYFLDKNINLKFDIVNFTTVDELRVFNSPKIYIDYSYLIELIGQEKVNYIFKEQEFIKFPFYFYCISDLNAINLLLENNKNFSYYLSQETSENKIIYSSSNLFVNKNASSLLESIYLIVILICCCLILTIINLSVFSLSLLFRKRKKEFALKLAFGSKIIDLKEEIFFQVSIILLFSSFLSLVFFYLVYKCQNTLITNLFNIRINYQLLFFDSKLLLVNLFIIIVCSLIITQILSTFINEKSLMEVFKNE